MRVYEHFVDVQIVKGFGTPESPYLRAMDAPANERPQGLEGGPEPAFGRQAAENKDAPCM